MEKDNINFIFKLLDKKMVVLCLGIEAVLDFIYYVIPFLFTFFLTMPFTLEKAVTITVIFILSKTIRTFGLYIERIIVDNYLYKYRNLEYEEYFKKIEKLPNSTLAKYQTGYLISVIDRVTMLVSEILQSEYIGIILSFAFLFYTSFTQSIYLFLLTLFCSIISVLISLRILKKANYLVEDLYEEEYEYSSSYQDYISNIKTVKALNSNKYFENMINKKAKNRFNKNKKYVAAYAKEQFLRNLFIIIPFAALLIKAVIDLSNGIDMLGIIAFYITLHVEMGFIFDELSHNIVNWFELSAIKKKLKEIFKVLDERTYLKDFNEIVLNNIEIKYKETKYSIKIPHLQINKNDKICFMGVSGSGKTSTLNLILGNLNIYTGEVSFDNHNIKDYLLDIGLVGQEIELFNMSIKDNLCLGKYISEEELIRHIKELQLDDILNFEEGLDTVIGEKGLKLSTGQKRRLNLLRSLLLNKNIYILDEPTSNLDNKTEKIVVNFIKNHFQDKTLIVATHNPEIKDICNKHYHFENHILVEEKE